MKPATKKWLVALALLALVAGLALSGATGALTLDNLRHQREWLLQARAQSPFLTAAIYFGAYVVYSGLAIPGAGVLTVAGGMLFGLGWGTLLASLASTTGASVACLLARYFLRDWIQSRFHDPLIDVNRGFQREGGFYLLSLRLIPLFPFFMINLVMGVLPIPLFRFFWISLVGMLPATFLYVNAGRQLGQVQSLGDIISLPVLVSFAVLGFIPLIGQWIFTWLRRTRVSTKS